MKIELTPKGARTFGDADEKSGVDNIVGFVRQALASGDLVMKSDDGQEIDPDDLDYVDDTGRDRSLRTGGASPNERAGGDGQPGNASPSDPSAAADRTAGTMDDRLSAIEAAVGKIVAGLYGGPENVRRALGERQPTGYGRTDQPHGQDPHDEDGDPRVQRPYNVNTGRPTGLTTDPDNQAMQDAIFADPARRGGKGGLPRGERGPWQVSPADSQNDAVVKALAESAGYTVVRKGDKGDWGATNGNPLSREETHGLVASLLEGMSDGAAGRW